jgi:RsiW-degrading membrane proteinase PrsW (M82 family)
VNLFLLLLTSVFAGILPMVCWAVLVWWFDRYEKEPVHLLLISFLWGMVPAVVISGITELILALFSGYEGGFASTGLTILNLGVMAPVVEEGMKFLGLLGVFWIAQREIDGPLDGIIYGAMVGFGFAATENFLYFLSSQTVAELLLLIFLRAMVFGVVHAMFTSFSGLGLAFAKYARPGWKAPLWAAGGYLAAVLFHGLFNTCIGLAAETPYTLLGLFGSLCIFGVGVSIILMLSIGSLIRERRTVKKYLQPYVERGIVKPQQWEAAASVWSRLYSEWEALEKLDFKKYRKVARLHTICAELAFKEKQQQLWGKDPKIDRQIAKLSLEMQTLSDVSSQTKI